MCEIEKLLKTSLMRKFWVGAVLVTFSFMVQAGSSLHLSCKHSKECDQQAQHWHCWSSSCSALAAGPRSSQVTVTGFHAPRLLCRELPLSKPPLSHYCPHFLWEVWCYVAHRPRPSLMCSPIVPLRFCLCTHPEQVLPWESLFACAVLLSALCWFLPEVQKFKSQSTI